MNIRVVYPSEDPEDYAYDISAVNAGIDEDNLRTFPVRFVWGMTKAVSIFATLIVSFTFWRFMTDLVTARGVQLIICGIISCVAFTVAIYTLLLRMLEKLESRMLKKAGAEFLESYTLSEYAERTDEEKHADIVQRYLERCLAIKRSQLLDVRIDLLDDESASVEFLYLTRGGTRETADFSLSYETTAYTDSVIVDLGREKIILPAAAVYS